MRCVAPDEADLVAERAARSHRAGDRAIRREIGFLVINERPSAHRDLYERERAIVSLPQGERRCWHERLKGQGEASL